MEENVLFSGSQKKYFFNKLKFFKRDFMEKLYAKMTLTIVVADKLGC